MDNKSSDSTTLDHKATKLIVSKNGSSLIDWIKVSTLVLVAVVKIVATMVHILNENRLSFCIENRTLEPFVTTDIKTLDGYQDDTMLNNQDGIVDNTSLAGLCSIYPWIQVLATRMENCIQLGTIEPTE
jgi:hypothetical protein